MTTEPTSEPSVKELAEKLISLNEQVMASDQINFDPLYRAFKSYRQEHALTIAQAYLYLLEESIEDARIISASGSRELALIAKVEKLERESNRHQEESIQWEEAHNTLKEKVERLEKAVKLAEKTFNHYANLHAAKPDPVKEFANRELAYQMHEALASTGNEEG